MPKITVDGVDREITQEELDAMQPPRVEPVQPTLVSEARRAIEALIAEGVIPNNKANAVRNRVGP
jgi:hypothetical protein